MGLLDLRGETYVGSAGAERRASGPLPGVGRGWGDRGSRGGAEILPGVALTPAPGHTIGHVAVSFESDGADRAFYLADTVMNAPNYQRPEVTTAFEQDRATAVETRRRMLGRAADEDRLVAAFHMSGYGRCQRDGEAFRYVPVS